MGTGPGKGEVKQLRGLRRISVAGAAVACGVTLDVVPGIPGVSGVFGVFGTTPAYAQSAGVSGVTVGHTSSGGGELVVAGTQQQFLPRGINSASLLYPDALSYTSPAEQSYFDSACSGVGTTSQQELTTAWNAMTTNTDTELLATTEHWQPNGTTSYPRLPTAQTKEAWAQLLPRLGNDPGIILEPLTLGNWLHQQVPGDVVLFDGDQFSGTFQGFTPTSFGMPATAAYAVHPLFCIDGPSGWNKRFGDLEAATSAGVPGQAVVANAWNRSHYCHRCPGG
jgi:hypothetical protein